MVSNKLASMPWRWILIGILCAFVVLSVQYNRETPYRTAGIVQRTQVLDVGAPDERQHANYVTRIQNGEGFPVFDAKDPNLYETYQSHQPPAYYLIAGGLARVMGADLTSSSGGFGLRLLSTFFGIGTILGVFFAARWGLNRDDIALCAAAICAFLPMFLALHSAISNDPMLFCLCTWSLALCAYMIRLGWDLPRIMLLGAIVGLALLTKTTALALLIVVAISIVASKKLSHPKLIAWSAVVIPLVVAAPWWIRNMNLYGDPFAMKAFKDAFTGSAQASMFIESFGALDYWVNWVGWWTLRSFIGAFGYMDIFFSDTLYRMIVAIFLVGALAWALKRSKPETSATADPASRSFTIVAWCFFAIILGYFFMFNMTYFQAQARYLYPAIAPISIGLSVGLCSLMQKRSYWTSIIVSALLIALNVYALSRLPDDFRKRGAVAIGKSTFFGASQSIV